MSARTKVSNVVYRAVSTLMMAVSEFIIARAAQTPVILKDISDLTPGAGASQIQFFSGYLAFLFATIAILVRSGAAIWLSALFGFVKMWSPLVIFRNDGYVASFRLDLIASFLCFLMLVALFWLVKKDEIRRP